MTKDILGGALEVGDHIVFIPQSASQTLSTGMVKGFFDGLVKIKVLSSGASDAAAVCLKQPSAVCKIQLPTGGAPND